MNSEECKIFVGGLSHSTTIDTLKSYFSNYGRVVFVELKRNPETMKSRGFGFVTFENQEVVDRVIKNAPHFLDGKRIDPKPAVPMASRKSPKPKPTKKLFLGNLPLEMKDDDLREHLSTYGVVIECNIMFDKNLKSRGFGFASFEDDSIVDNLINQQYIDVQDKKVQVKLANPRPVPMKRMLPAFPYQQRLSLPHPPAFPYNNHYGYGGVPTHFNSGGPRVNFVNGGSPIGYNYRAPPPDFNDGFGFYSMPKRPRIGPRTPPLPPPGYHHQFAAMPAPFSAPIRHGGYMQPEAMTAFMQQATTAMAQFVNPSQKPGVEAGFNDESSQWHGGE